MMTVEYLVKYFSSLVWDVSNKLIRPKPTPLTGIPSLKARHVPKRNVITRISTVRMLSKNGKTKSFVVVIKPRNLIEGRDSQKNLYSLVFVNDSIEQLAVPPAGGEVLTPDVLIAIGDPLGPEQQLLFGRHII